MPKHIIHVNQHVIKCNRKTGERNPVLTCKSKSGGRTVYAHQIAIVDTDGKEVARVVYSLDKPLSCGAVCWIETELTVKSL